MFASLGYPSDDFAVVMLSPQDQDHLVRDHPATFAPAAGKWGAAGSTTIRLSAAPPEVVAITLQASWRRRASKRLVAVFEHASRSVS